MDSDDITLHIITNGVVSKKVALSDFISACDEIGGDMKSRAERILNFTKKNYPITNIGLEIKEPEKDGYSDLIITSFKKELNLGERLEIILKQ